MENIYNKNKTQYPFVFVTIIKRITETLVICYYQKHNNVNNGNDDGDHIYNK